MFRHLTCALFCAGAFGIHATESMTSPLKTSFSFPEPGILRIECSSGALAESDSAIFVALDTATEGGTAVVPFRQWGEGSTVFLPFQADRVYAASLKGPDLVRWMRIWKNEEWSKPTDGKREFQLQTRDGSITMDIRLAELGKSAQIGVAVYAKNLRENDGWGTMLPSLDGSTVHGTGDSYIRFWTRVDLAKQTAEPIRYRIAPERVRIYQLLPRLFSNVNETRKPNGTMAENGVGKFNDINEAALASLRLMNFTHIWLTGVLAQCTATDYSEIGLPADDPDLLKGLAGSPYAIKDYFDVSPDYAHQPIERLAEFKALLDRIHENGLRTVIDFVPNHVARSYRSTIRPNLSFGANDDATKFFDSRNNFYHLAGEPLRLPTMEGGRAVSPTCAVLGTCDGRFEREDKSARVTGNNVTSPSPSLNDWYETVKLNYGYDFPSGRRHYPHAGAADAPVPDTWLKMDAVLAYWQEMGVDGFRCDMAHMVPPEFWAWALGRARTRQPEVFFAAEAYDNDPMKVAGANPLMAALNDRRGNVMLDLLSAGFDAVYDDPSYKKLKSVYDGQGWANDLDEVKGSDFLSQNALRYAENHDEVRIAGRDQWGNLGAAVGRPISAVLYGLGRGPVLLYSGQEVGEPAAGSEGFGGNDSRTTIFDYWAMPELAKWVNDHRYDGGRLSPEQKQLRAFYARLLALVGEPAFRDGELFPLNPANNQNPHYGRLAGETASGHWLYSFLRRDAASSQSFLVVANLHGSETLRDVRVQFPREALDFLQVRSGQEITATERLSSQDNETLRSEDASQITVPRIGPLTPLYFELHLPTR